MDIHTTFNRISEKEEDLFLSLFRIPLFFFGDDEKDDESDELGDDDFDDDDDSEGFGDDDDDFDDDDDSDDDSQGQNEDKDNDKDNKDDEKDKDSDKDKNDDDEKKDNEENDDENKDKKEEEQDKDNDDADEKKDPYGDPFNVDDKDDDKDNKDTDDKDKKDGDDEKKDPYGDPFNVDDKDDNKDNKDSDDKDKKDPYGDPFNVDDKDDNKDNKDSDDKNKKDGNDEKKDPYGDPFNVDDRDNSKKTATGNTDKKNPQKDKDNKKSKDNKDKDNKNDTINNARNKKPKDNNAKPSSSSDSKSPNKPEIPGSDKFSKAKQGLDTIKNAKDDPMAAAEKIGTEVAKKGAKAAGNAIAPGVGNVAEKVIDVGDKIIGKSEMGRKLKTACCASCMICSCLSVLSALAIIMLPILLLTVIVQSIFGIFQVDDEVEKEKPQLNFIEVLEEDTLDSPKTSLVNILEDALEDVGYYKQKEAEEKGEEYEEENGSSSIVFTMMDNYSVSSLKYPTINSKPEDFPEADLPNNMDPYFSMQKKHMALFQDLLDNLLEKDYNDLPEDKKQDANVLKKLFNNESKVVKFIDDNITKELDKTYNVYNPLNNIYEIVTLRKLFEETSTARGDAQYDVYTVSRILGDTKNSDIIEAFYDLQESITKVEIMVYMQAFKQYNMQISSMRRSAENASYTLPDVYFTDEFFTQFSTITDVASYMSLAMLCDDPAIVYEIARETIYIYNEPIEVTQKTLSNSSGAQNIGYIPILKTWYGNYTFDLVQTGENTVLQCTGCDSKQLDEQSWDRGSNLLKRYNIDDKDQFFTLFMEATGIDPVEGTENIYTPYELDENWQTTVEFYSSMTKGSSSNIYTYTTTKYLNDSGGSSPLATDDYYISMNYMQKYKPETIEKFNLSHDEHYGIDYSVDEGTDVLAIKDGTVIAVEFGNTGFGNYVKIEDSDGYVTTYAHGNGRFNVAEGDKVVAGTKIMESGNSGNSTGPHLHLETRDYNNNLVNPAEYGGFAVN